MKAIVHGFWWVVLCFLPLATGGSLRLLFDLFLTAVLLRRFSATELFSGGAATAVLAVCLYLFGLIFGFFGEDGDDGGSDDESEPEDPGPGGLALNAPGSEGFMKGAPSLRFLCFRSDLNGYSSKSLQDGL